MAGLQWAAVLWGMTLIAIVVPRTVSSPNLWWHLARGREVVSGTLYPSRALLVLETNADSDWLGGVPFFLVWSIGGPLALSLIPPLAALILWPLSRLSSSLRSSQRLALILLLPLILYVLRDGLEPVPRLFDVFGLVLTARLINADRNAPRRGWLTAVLFAVWANLSTGPLWGLILLLMALGSRGSSLAMLAAAAVGGSLTPRGPLSWYDSFLLLGSSAVPEVGLTGTIRLLPQAFGPETTAPLTAFLLLWTGWVAWQMLTSRRATASLPATFLQALVPLAVGLLRPENLPLAATWILIQLSLLAPERTAGSPSSATTGHEAGTEPSPRSQFVRGCAVALMVTLLLADCDWLPLTGGRRPGWGISSRIDHRLLDPVWRISPDRELRLWTADAGSAGMIAWLGENLRLVDHPERAVRGGRWPVHAGIVADIAGDHRARYRRADGTWGGWEPQLSEWDVTLLGIPAGSDLHPVLSTTPWKSLDLDSPCILYVSTENLEFAGVIVELLRQQGFVEAGPWRPDPGIYSGHGWRGDLLELLGLGLDPVPAITLSAHFRRLDLPMAAARALLPVRTGMTGGTLRREFARVQHAFVDLEQEIAGRVSPFRQAVLQATGSAASVSRDANEQSTAPDSASLAAAVALYLQGQQEEALTQLRSDDPDHMYAAAMLMLELGDTEPAWRLLQKLPAHTQDRTLTILSRYWLRQMDSFVSAADGPQNE